MGLENCPYYRNFTVCWGMSEVRNQAIHICTVYKIRLDKPLVLLRAAPSSLLVGKKNEIHKMFFGSDFVHLLVWVALVDGAPTGEGPKGPPVSVLDQGPATSVQQ